MQNLITIYCKNTKQYHDIPCGTSLKDLYKMLALEMPHPVIAARVNYKVQSLNFLIYKPKDIEFIDATGVYPLFLIVLYILDSSRLFPTSAKIASS